ncbi:MAG: sigma-70 family RNA polymerase sigma factor [Sedimentisphaerales bacterium]|nr:sigma-70 family RNA polymerase sigma factor [Sedimentisphaerales bacterium]
MMLEDQLLIWQLKGGDTDAFCQVYRRYRTDLLRLAALLLHDRVEAEDIVHDVFVSLAKSAEGLTLRKSLKGYLLTCVANAARNRNRASQRRRAAGLDEAATVPSPARTPEQWVTYSEQLERWSGALAQLPYEQREAVVMHLRGGVKFGQIARLQGVSVNTAKGRYRYALEKLRSVLNSELES